MRTRLLALTGFAVLVAVGCPQGAAREQPSAGGVGVTVTPSPAVMEAWRAESGPAAEAPLTAESCLPFMEDYLRWHQAHQRALASSDFQAQLGNVQREALPDAERLRGGLDRLASDARPGALSALGRLIYRYQLAERQYLTAAANEGLRRSLDPDREALQVALAGLQVEVDRVWFDCSVAVQAGGQEIPLWPFGSPLRAPRQAPLWRFWWTAVRYDGPGDATTIDCRSYCEPLGGDTLATLEAALESERGWQAAGVDFVRVEADAHVLSLKVYVTHGGGFVCEDLATADGHVLACGSGTFFTHNYRVSRTGPRCFIFLHEDRVTAAIVNHEVGHCLGLEHHGGRGIMREFADELATAWPTEEELRRATRSTEMWLAELLSD